MSRPLSKTMVDEVIRVMTQYCETSNFAVRDAYSFADMIPKINRHVSDVKQKFKEQPPEVLKILARCDEAGKKLRMKRVCKVPGIIMLAAV